MDRLTDWTGELARLINNYPFNQADGLWNSFQNKIKDFVNSHGGSASLTNFVNKKGSNPYQYYRPEWQMVKDVIDGALPLSTLSTDCPD